MSRYIDADALIQHIENLQNINSEDDCFCGNLQAFKSILNFQPTADVVEKEKWDRLLENSIILADAVQKYQLADVAEVKHGKNISDSGFLCNICSFGDFGGFHGYEPNYCPNCGARMERNEE